MIRRMPASKADVARAMQQLEQLYPPTERQQAEARMRRAKAQFTEAAEAAQRGDTKADALADTAVLELDAAWKDLRALDALDQAAEPTQRGAPPAGAGL
jgi:hypothetical protein